MTERQTADNGAELVVDVQGLNFAYGDYQAVQEVDLHIEAGQLHGLLGTNGAGKTTTLELIQGFRSPSGGAIRLFGMDPRTDAAYVRRNTGVVLQEAGFYQELTVRETVAMWAQLSSRIDDVDRVLAVVGLDHRAEHTISTLSGGERRRLDLALAIWGEPRLLILDEPTTGLDPESRNTLWEVVRRLRDHGTTIILTTHYLEEVEVLADTVSIMHTGRVAVAGTIEQVLASRPATIRAQLETALFPTGWPGPAPKGVDVHWESAGRVGSESGGRVLVVSSRDQHGALSWVMAAADRSQVRFRWIRATPASLEEIFLDISGRQHLEEDHDRVEA